MIWIFAILVILMFLVLKFCKKTLKIALSVLIILATLYCGILSVDMNRVYNFKKPIFAVSSEAEDKEIYKGFGYTVAIERNENKKVISSTMYFFNKVIAGAIE